SSTCILVPLSRSPSDRSQTIRATATMKRFPVSTRIVPGRRGPALPHAGGQLEPDQAGRLGQAVLDVQAALAIEGDPGREGELTVAATLRAEAPDQLPRCVVGKDPGSAAAVGTLVDEEATDRVDGHVGGQLREVPVTDGSEQRPVRVEDEHLRGLGRAHVEVALAIDRQRVRAVIRGEARERVEAAEDLAAGVVVLDDLPAIVDHPDRPVRAHGDAHWVAELARCLAEFAPLTEELAVGVEVLDPPVADVKDEERAVRREREGSVAVAVLAGEVELTRLFAGRAPLLEELPGRVEDRDPVSLLLRRPDPARLRLDRDLTDRGEAHLPDVRRP